MGRRKRRNIAIFISWTMVVIWMGVIFSLSAQPAVASNELSHGVTEVIVETVERVAPAANVDVETANHFIRKNAHFFAYLILAVLVSHAFARHGLLGKENGWHTFMICVLYAISDEMHQMLVPGRGPAVTDVFIDGAGVFLGLILYYLAHGAVMRVVRSD